MCEERWVRVRDAGWEIRGPQWLLTEKMDCYGLIDLNLSQGADSVHYREKRVAALPLFGPPPMQYLLSLALYSHLHRFYTTHIIPLRLLHKQIYIYFFKYLFSSVLKLWGNFFRYCCLDYWCQTTMADVTLPATAAPFPEFTFHAAEQFVCIDWVSLLFACDRKQDKQVGKV